MIMGGRVACGTNIAPEKSSWKMSFLLGRPDCQVLCLSYFSTRTLVIPLASLVLGKGDVTTSCVLTVTRQIFQGCFPRSLNQ